MTSLALGCWRTSHFCPLVEEVFSPIRELLVTDRVCMTLLHHQDSQIILLYVHSCHSTVDCFPPLEVFMVHSDTTKLVLRQKTFRSLPTKTLVGPLSEVHVFSNRDLPSAPELQPRAISVAYHVVGVYWTILSNSSKKEWLLLLVIWVLYQIVFSKNIHTSHIMQSKQVF